MSRSTRSRRIHATSKRFEGTFDDVTLVARNGQTTLRAELVDQSQLYGLLNRLRDLGMELISVNKVPARTDAS
jgi:hypothetical protein